MPTLQLGVPNSLLLAAVVLIGTVIGIVVPPNNFKWCSAFPEEHTKCLQLQKGFAAAKLSKAFSIDCRMVPSESKCLYDIGQGNMDVTFAKAKNVYAAGKNYGLIPSVAILNAQDLPANFPYVDATVAVIRKSNTNIRSLADLKGKRSCHTAVGRNMAWGMPISFLNSKDFFKGPQYKDCLDNVENVAKFFSQSCAPGSQNSYYNPLGEKVDNLCSLCGSPKPKFCTVQDIYANYSGVAKCMSDGKADVGFLLQGIMEAETEGVTEEGRRLQDFELLCTDGSRKNFDQYKSCNWGFFGNDGIMASPKLSANKRATLREMLLNMEALFKPQNINVFATEDSIFGNSSFGFWNPKTDNYKDILSPDMLRLMDDQYKECGHDVPSEMRWCTISPQEEEKCQQMSVAFITSYIKPSLHCVSANSLEGCMSLIKEGKADLINIDGGDIYTAGKYYSLKPIMYEDYGSADATYYSVAVAKKSSGPKLNFKTLKGYKSCHTAVSRTAGWNVPVAELINAKLISVKPEEKCKHFSAVSKFFSQSCAPGALEDPAQPNVQSLCALCKGQGKDKCTRSDKEPYFGYVGALRCLVEGGGDVAFVNHLTVSENVDGKNTAEWAKNLKATDFELLCKDGTRRPINQAAKCNLARVPSHAIVTAGSKTRKQVDAFVLALKKAQAFYVRSNPTSTSCSAPTHFIMFGTGVPDVPKDIMFRDGAKSLIRISDDKQDYKKYLGTYLSTAEFMDCRGTKSS